MQRKVIGLSLSPAAIERYLPQLSTTIDAHLTRWSAAGRVKLTEVVRILSTVAITYTLTYAGAFTAATCDWCSLISKVVSC